jgi:hypothetical protein
MAEITPVEEGITKNGKNDDTNKEEMLAVKTAEFAITRRKTDICKNREDNQDENANENRNEKHDDLPA